MNVKRSSQLIGIAGVHYVASCLSFRGFHAVPTTRNVRGPDLLVSNIDGSKGASLQVKTAVSAVRTRGRGDDKKPHHYEWDIGWSSAKINHPHLFFALVDLKYFKGLPDIFIVPSNVVFKYFEEGDPKTWPRARYHPLLEKADQYKNNWNSLEEALKKSTK